MPVVVPWVAPGCGRCIRVIVRLLDPPLPGMVARLYVVTRLPGDGQLRLLAEFLLDLYPCLLVRPAGLLGLLHVSAAHSVGEFRLSRSWCYARRQLDGTAVLLLVRVLLFPLDGQKFSFYFLVLANHCCHAVSLE